MEMKTVTAKEFEKNFDDFMNLLDSKDVFFKIIRNDGVAVYLRPYIENDEIR